MTETAEETSCMNSKACVHGKQRSKLWKEQIKTSCNARRTVTPNMEPSTSATFWTKSKETSFWRPGELPLISYGILNKVTHIDGEYTVIFYFPLIKLNSIHLDSIILTLQNPWWMAFLVLGCVSLSTSLAFAFRNLSILLVTGIKTVLCDNTWNFSINKSKNRDSIP